MNSCVFLSTSAYLSDEDYHFHLQWNAKVFAFSISSTYYKIKRSLVHKSNTSSNE